MEELKKYRLGDIADVQTGPFGSQLHNEDYVESGTPIVTVEHLGNKYFSTQNLPLVSDKDKTRLKKYILEENDIVFSRVGSVDRCSIVSENEIGWLFSGRCLRVRPQSFIVDGDYLYYYFCQETFKDYIRNKAVGCTMPSLNTDLLSEIELSLPSLATQKRISSVLSNIDRLISTKRNENSTLEAMAKEIYDYWFVQFDFPNNDGKPYKSSGGKMVFNEILKREIPEGWEVKRLGEFLTIKNGKDHKHLDNGNFPVYGSGGFMRSVSQYLYEGESVLMPRKGSLNNVLYVNEAFWTVDTMFYSIPKIEHSAKYVYYSIKDIDFTRLNSGTGVPSMTSTTLYDIKLVKPSNELISQFDKILNPIYAYIFSNRQQIQNLTSLRDYLLPLLMNGQVEVKEAETKFQEMYSEMAMVAEEGCKFGE